MTTFPIARGKFRMSATTLVLLLTTGAAEADPKVTGTEVGIGTVVVVKTGGEPRIDSPVLIELTSSKFVNDSERVQSVRLVEITGGQERLVRSQIESGKSPRLWWIADGTTPANSKRIYRIDAADPADETAKRGSNVELDRKPDFVEFRIGASPVLRYHSSLVEATEGLDRKYGRSGHIHPAWTPSGAVVTDQFPPDHAHQSGLYLAYVNTEFEGRTPDFWNLLKGTGKVRSKEIRNLATGPVFGELVVEHEHIDLLAPGGKVAILETWGIRVWNLNHPKPAFWICDIESRLTCATASPVRLKEYHYGGMALRGAREWSPENSHFLTSEGKTRIEGNHTRPRWCDLSGQVRGQNVGITIMTHARNFRYPEPLRIHPTMPYMVYTPSQLGDWDLSPDQQPVLSRYRFLFHDGEIPAKTADRLSQDFNEPLVAVVQP